MKRRAHIIIGLGYGDEGKGTMVDAFVEKTGAPTVVRFNGGGQAAHNVVTEKYGHHTFAQWGSGTFRGAKTILSRYMMVHPTAALIEAEKLHAKGVEHPLGLLTVDARCMITTPYHQAMNRLRELERGDLRHGSCGVGVGETMDDHYSGYHLFAQDLAYPQHLRTKLMSIRARKLDEAASFNLLDVKEAAQKELDILQNDTWLERLLAFYAMFAAEVTIKEVTELPKGDVVFEGAQGALLDEFYGWQPHTTWSKTTSHNAHRFLDEINFEGERHTIGVLRAFATRHGPGPMVSEDREMHPTVLDGEHNGTGAWQGAFRVGWFDAVATRYALAADQERCTGIAVTCIDRMQTQKAWRVCAAYNTSGGFPLYALDANHPALSAADMFKMTPRWLNIPRDEASLLGYIQGVTGRPIVCESHGAASTAKIWL